MVCWWQLGVRGGCIYTDTAKCSATQSNIASQPGQRKSNRWSIPCLFPENGFYQCMWICRRRWPAPEAKHINLSGIGISRLEDHDSATEQYRISNDQDAFWSFSPYFSVLMWIEPCKKAFCLMNRYKNRVSGNPVCTSIVICGAERNPISTSTVKQSVWVKF